MSSVGGSALEVGNGTLKIRMGESLDVVGSLRPGFPTPTSNATFTLRFEHIVVGHAASTMRNRFEGRVEQFLYVGDATKYVVRLDPQVVITMRQNDNAAEKPMQIGEKVVIGWQESDMLLVEADGHMTSHRVSSEGSRP
jgi:ABC-type Fe3+/spermidine/putrescine transport system ATPase subunit